MLKSKMMKLFKSGSLHSAFLTANRMTKASFKHSKACSYLI